MSDDDTPDTDTQPSVDEAIGIWYDLERARAGKNGYGGDVAEIYAHRLVPPQAKLLDLKNDASLANLAGRNLTRILRRFVELYHVDIAVEEREGFRTIDFGCEDFPPFDWRVHLRVTRLDFDRATAPPIHELRKTLAKAAGYLGDLAAMLDELAAYRAKDRLAAEARDPADTDDLPPDAATGLYLDVPFAATDLEWIKMAWDAYLSRNNSATRPGQLLLVFQAIRRDERTLAEFLRVMNTIVLPLCRRIRLKEQPHLIKLGAVNE